MTKRIVVEMDSMLAELLSKTGQMIIVEYRDGVKPVAYGIQAKMTDRQNPNKTRCVALTVGSDGDDRFVYCDDGNLEALMTPKSLHDAFLWRSTDRSAVHAKINALRQSAPRGIFDFEPIKIGQGESTF